MKIFFSPTSPYVRKCLVTAHELGLHERLQLLPSNAHPIDRDANIIASNPLGKVPTFLADDGLILYDSRVICEYLNSEAGGSLLPAAGPARWNTLTLLALADGMLDAALLARYEDVARPEPLRWAEWRAAQLDKSRTALAHLEPQADALHGRVDLASIALGCALWYLDFRFADFDWRADHPGVARWYADFAQRPSMQATWAL